MNALELAKDLEEFERCTESVANQAAAELRRLHAINAELVKALKAIKNTDWVDNALDPQRPASIARQALEKAKKNERHRSK